MIHNLKCWPEYFQAVKSGIKPFELRKDDRNYAVGDILHLREFEPETEQYTGDEIDKIVTYILPTTLFGALVDGVDYVIMGLAPRDWTPCAEGLPEKVYCRLWSKNVLVTVEQKTGERYVIEAYYHYGHDEWKNDTEEYFMGEVIAWMPKPAPYRADQKEDADGN